MSRNERTLVRWLRQGREVGPPPGLDAQIRSALRAAPQPVPVPRLRRPAPPRPILQPLPALAMAMVAFGSLVVGVGMTLPDTWAGTSSELLAALLGFAYLSVSVTASLPVLMARGRAQRQNGETAT